MTQASAGAPQPVLGITMGDPAGVGPELCLRALREPAVTETCIPVVFGSPDLMDRVARACDIPFEAAVMEPDALSASSRPSQPTIVNCGDGKLTGLKPGLASAPCGEAAASYIRTATQAALARDIDAVVTTPINKEALNAAGIPHPGHTEFIAELTGAARTRMMMASDTIIVSLVTIHVPLARVPELLNSNEILDTMQLTDSTLRQLGRTHPRLTVCGLNPHAGEGGLFGDEERRVIQPAIDRARDDGLNVRGPLSPDTAFCREQREATDAYVVMYHDQGLIPFKMLTFGTGVNITLGLPIVRTSVDHGTAFDIAWTGKASPTSLYAAVDWAIRLTRRR